MKKPKVDHLGWPEPKSLSKARLAEIVTDIQDVLWGSEEHTRPDPDAQWDSDTLDNVVQVLADAGLRPEEPTKVDVEETRHVGADDLIALMCELLDRGDDTDEVAQAVYDNYSTGDADYTLVGIDGFRINVFNALDEVCGLKSKDVVREAWERVTADLTEDVFVRLNG